MRTAQIAIIALQLIASARAQSRPFDLLLQADAVTVYKSCYIITGHIEKYRINSYRDTSTIQLHRLRKQKKCCTTSTTMILTIRYILTFRCVAEKA